VCWSAPWPSISRTSQVTIRKDLDILQAHGRIHRTHGGALPALASALEDLTLREKENCTAWKSRKSRPPLPAW
jgi:DeoR/GlpR family transcriptional regulator of sugar metabolism